MLFLCGPVGAAVVAIWTVLRPLGLVLCVRTKAPRTSGFGLRRSVLRNPATILGYVFADLAQRFQVASVFVSVDI